MPTLEPKPIPIPIPVPIPAPMPAPTQTQLQAGLGGAIGSAFNATQKQLVFVEYGGKLSSLTVAPATPAYKVLGTGYTTPEDVKLSTDGVHAYVTERSGDLVKVALSSANRSAATVVATGMNSPQQMFLDEAHNAAYVVEYASPGRLLKINLTSGAKTAITGALTYPIGVVLSADLQYAYVSDQAGHINEVQISSGAVIAIASGLTNPFFLTWADAAQDSLYVPQRDPSNSIVTVNVTSGAVNTVVTGVPFRPSSVTVPYSGQLLVCCDSVIEEVVFGGITSTAPLLMGIGQIPANYINHLTGLATTPAGSPYQVTGAPFGGTLPIMVNFEAAYNAGARYYQVQVDTATQTGSWTVYWWNGTTNQLNTVAPATVGGATGCYPVHAVADLFNYQPPALGYELDSTALSNGQHTIELQFLDGAGNKLTPNLVSEAVVVEVNNQPCVAVLVAPVLNTSPTTTSADSCGVLHYGMSETTTVSLAFTASQPANYANFSMELVRGVTAVGVPLPSGPVTAAPGDSPVSPAPTVSALLDKCPTAGFAAELYVAATMTNGNGRQSQYDAEALMGFVLTT
ncbi:MAG TPA: hypothetical protein VMA34_03295 [Terracidiphilus sp.]|nr:hypothetical protein [Terracidiphilus sp.]